MIPPKLSPSSAATCLINLSILGGLSSSINTTRFTQVKPSENKSMGWFIWRFAAYVESLVLPLSSRKLGFWPKNILLSILKSRLTHFSTCLTTYNFVWCFGHVKHEFCDKSHSPKSESCWRLRDLNLLFTSSFSTTWNLKEIVCEKSSPYYLAVSNKDNKKITNKLHQVTTIIFPYIYIEYNTACYLHIIFVIKCIIFSNTIDQYPKLNVSYLKSRLKEAKGVWSHTVLSWHDHYFSSGQTFGLFLQTNNRYAWLCLLTKKKI